MATILRNARAAFAALLAVLVAGCGGSGGREALPGPGDFDTSFGGSSLGTWIDDELGLPAFRYDGCTAGPCASEPADAFHQLGNGNVTAIAHKRRLRRAVQREDVLPARESLRRGGAELRRRLRMGPRRRPSLEHAVRGPSRGGVLRAHLRYGLHEEDRRARRLRVEQYVSSPPGSDEVLLEHLVVTNVSSAAKSIKYFDYWDVAWWLLRHTDPITRTSIYDPARRADELRRGAPHPEGGEPRRPG
jgi:hypothetical protein